MYWAGQKDTPGLHPGTEIPLDSSFDFEPAEAVGLEDGRILFSHAGENFLQFSVPLQSNSGYDKLKLYFTAENGTGFNNAGHIQVLFKYSKTTQGTVSDHYTKIVKPLMEYEIPLSDKRFDSISIRLRTSKQPIDVQLYKLELLPDKLEDSLFFEWTVATLILLLVLLPGILILGAVVKPGPSSLVQLSIFYLGSILYYTLLFVVLIAGFWYGLEDTGQLTTSILLLSLGALFILNYWRQRFRTLRCFLTQHKLILVFFCFAFYSLTLYISHGTNYTFANMTWQSIAGPKTFKTIHSHDNYFQFANGRIIEEKLPFSAEYGDKSKGQRPLFYYPEDRTMLSGAIYAVFRDVLKNIYTRVGNSFYAYSITGIAMNLFILFPLFCLVNRYLQSWRIWLCMLLLTVNGVFIVESLVTWFKFCGGALFITAIYLLLNDRKNVSNWLLAGLSLGLATNMHASVALGMPFLLTWLGLRHIKECRFLSFRWIAGPLSLLGIFILTNLPWKIVKATYFENSIALVATHFLGGYRVGNDFFTSARLFFENIPLSEQIPHRINRILTFFRQDELYELFGHFSTNSFSNFLFYWTHLEVGYTVFLYYPMMLLILLGTSNVNANTTSTASVAKLSECISLGIISWLSQLVYIFATFGGQSPDVVWHQPLGLTMIVYASMVMYLLRQSKTMSYILVFYLLFSLYRITTAHMFIQ